MKRVKLICPICNQELQPSLGYGKGYWICNCTITPQDKKEWVEQIESIFKNKTGLPAGHGD